MRLVSILILSLCCACPAFSDNTAIVDNSLLFQVVQDQFVFNNKTVEKASLIEKPDGSFRGLMVVLKKPVSEVMRRVSTFGIGKTANLILDNKIVTTVTIKSPFGDKLLLVGLTKEEAQGFIETLKRNDPKYKKSAKPIT